jgi:hypothetical protein
VLARPDDGSGHAGAPVEPAREKQNTERVMSFLVAGGLLLSALLADIVLDDIVGARWLAIKSALGRRVKLRSR